MRSRTWLPRLEATEVRATTGRRRTRIAVEVIGDGGARRRGALRWACSREVEVSRRAVGEECGRVGDDIALPRRLVGNGDSIEQRIGREARVPEARSEWMCAS